MSQDEIKFLRGEIKDLMKAITDVNDNLQKWTIEDYNWKKQEIAKRMEFEEKVKPMLVFYEDWTRTKRVVLWLVGGLSAVFAFYLLVFEVLKTIWTK